MKKKALIISAIAVWAAVVVAAVVVFLLPMLNGGTGNTRDFGGFLPEVPATPAREFAYDDLGEAVEITCYNGDRDEISIPDTINGKPVEKVSFDCDASVVILPDSVKEFEIIGAESVNIPASAVKYSFGATAAVPDDSLKKVYIPAGAAVPVSAFAHCRELSEVFFEDGVKEIGDAAFNNCPALETIDLPESLETIGNSAFSKCSSLREIKLPEGLKNIGYLAFSECSSLTKVVLPESLTQVTDSLFFRCGALAEVEFGGNITELGDSAFSECGSLIRVELPEKLVRIGNGCFQNCANLEEVIMHEGVKSIGENAFFGCTKLKNVTIPDTLEEIGANAFDDSSWLDSKGSEMIVINNILFRYTGSAAEVVIPDGITSISAAAFQNNKTITSITMPDSVTSVGAKAFAGCTALTGVRLSAGLTEIPESLFYGCSALVSVILPDSITVIENGAFGDCTALMIIIIPIHVTRIGDNAFYNCTSLVNIEIPESVAAIGDRAFSGCTSLVGLTIKGRPTLGNGAFSGCEKLTNITADDSVTDGADSSVFEGCVSYISNPDIWSYLPVIPASAEELFEYSEEDGGVAVTGYTGSSMDIRIPEKIGGKPVVRVDLPAVKATELILPDSVKEFTIDYSRLKYLNIPESCAKLPEFGKMNVKIVLVFVYIGDGVTALPDGMFAGCAQLTGVRIPDSVSEIADGVFADCGKLTSVAYKGAALGYDDLNGPKPMSQSEVDTICTSILHITQGNTFNRPISGSSEGYGMYMDETYNYNDINDFDLETLMNIANVYIKPDKTMPDESGYDTMIYYTYQRVEEHIKKYVNPSFDIAVWKKRHNVPLTDEYVCGGYAGIGLGRYSWEEYPRTYSSSYAGSGTYAHKGYIVDSAYSIGSKYYVNVIGYIGYGEDWDYHFDDDAYQLIRNNSVSNMMQDQYPEGENVLWSSDPTKVLLSFCNDSTYHQLTLTKRSDGTFQIESMKHLTEPSDTVKATNAILKEYYDISRKVIEEKEMSDYGKELYSSTINSIGVFDLNGHKNVVILGFNSAPYRLGNYAWGIKYDMQTNTLSNVNGYSLYYDNENKEYVLRSGIMVMGEEHTNYYSLATGDEVYFIDRLTDYQTFEMYYVFNNSEHVEESSDKYEEYMAYVEKRFTPAYDKLTDCSGFTVPDLSAFIRENAG